MKTHAQYTKYTHNTDRHTKTYTAHTIPRGTQRHTYNSESPYKHKTHIKKPNTHTRPKGTSRQCVAVCCSVLQCVAVCCSVLQSAAVCCSVLQCLVVLIHIILNGDSLSGHVITSRQLENLLSHLNLVNLDFYMNESLNSPN